MTLHAKPKLALYWGAACGGCDMAVLEIGERLEQVAAAVALVFWPCVLDFKRADVVAMPDGDIDVCLFNGAIRSAEQRESESVAVTAAVPVRVVPWAVQPRAAPPVQPEALSMRSRAMVVNTCGNGRPLSASLETSKSAPVASSTAPA